VLDEAQGYGVRAGSDRLLIDIATLAGDAWVSLARLDEAERVLAAALAAAKATGDCAQSAGASLSLARCLFWRGHYADAQALLAAPPDGVLRDARVAPRQVGVADRCGASGLAVRDVDDRGCEAAVPGMRRSGHRSRDREYSRVRSSGGRRSGRRRSRRCRIDGLRRGRRTIRCVA
jgi:hypothetical protein